LLRSENLSLAHCDASLHDDVHITDVNQSRKRFSIRTRINAMTMQSFPSPCSIKFLLFRPPIFSVQSPPCLDLEKMAKTLTRADVLQTYRYLLRSMAIAFQGDTVTLLAARKEARSRFEGKRNLNVDTTEAADAIAEARSVAKFLRENLVQGIRDGESETFSMN
jgi:hypothetical protein